MEISNMNNTQSFGMKLKNNSAFGDIVNYARQSKQVRKLDNALNTLLHTNEGDVLTILHGKTPDGITYSNFSVGRKFVPNRTNGLEPAQASFDALMKLAELDESLFKKLTGKAAQLKYSVAELINKYTV